MASQVHTACAMLIDCGRLSPFAETCVGPAGLWNGVPVAIKIVPSFKIARSELALQEAVLGSTIQHPNVVR